MSLKDCSHISVVTSALLKDSPTLSTGKHGPPRNVPAVLRVSHPWNCRRLDGDWVAPCLSLTLTQTPKKQSVPRPNSSSSLASSPLAFPPSPVRWRNQVYLVGVSERPQMQAPRCSCTDSKCPI